MKSMVEAIRSKRMSMGGSDKMEPVQDEQGSHMQSLVDSLDEHQKQELLGLLQSSSGKDAAEIQKGAPGPGERKEISQKAKQEAAQEGESPEVEQQEKDELGDTDDIAMGMVDRGAFKKVEDGARPRNLGERVKMEIAKNLKAKGKVK